MTLEKPFFNKYIFLIVLGVIIGGNNPAQGYEVPAHSILTENAYNSSLLNTGYLQSLGIVGEKVAGKKAVRWVVEGAQFEDGEPVGSKSARPLNHFFDPVTQSGLTVLGIPLGTDAINWGLENRTLGTFTQDYSIKDARSYLFTGLTGLDDIGSLVVPTTEDREAFLGKAFRSVGQVVHLIQYRNGVSS
ncbi:MAG TPA: hypothetical protein VIU33_03090 [Nitrospiria bacterium]